MNEPATQPNPAFPPEDPQTLLRMMDLQIAVQRARRENTQRRRIGILAALFLAGLGGGGLAANWYFKSVASHPPASQAPATSTGRLR